MSPGTAGRWLTASCTCPPRGPVIGAGAPRPGSIWTGTAVVGALMVDEQLRVGGASRVVTMAPAVSVRPIVIGGNSEVAIRRARPTATAGFIGAGRGVGVAGPSAVNPAIDDTNCGSQPARSG
jgi:hypothetical protein